MVKKSLLLLPFLILFVMAGALGIVGWRAANIEAQSKPDNGPVAAASPTATPTAPPPPPKVEYTPVAPDTISPIVVQRFPRRGEEFPIDGTLELIFDRPMDQPATEAAFTLQTAADQPQAIEGQVTWPDERTMHFVPAQSLERATVFDAILTQTATAADGAPLAEPFTFRFSTPGYLEVTQVVPGDGTMGVETDPTITVMFNRPVVPLTSLQAAENFPQPLEFEPAIAGEGEWLNTSIYLFTPAEPLPGGVTYQARVKAGLTDVSGQTLLPQDFEWRFVTQPPEVIFTEPNDGQTLVIEFAECLPGSEAGLPDLICCRIDLAASVAGLIGDTDCLIVGLQGDTNNDHQTNLIDAAQVKENNGQAATFDPRRTSTWMGIST